MTMSLCVVPWAKLAVLHAVSEILTFPFGLLNTTMNLPETMFFTVAPGQPGKP